MKVLYGKFMRGIIIKIAFAYQAIIGQFTWMFFNDVIINACLVGNLHDSDYVTCKLSYWDKT